MDHPSTPADAAAQLAAAVPAMQDRAVLLDQEERFPEEDMALLRVLGLLAAPLPRRLGGWGAGTEPEGAALLLDLLRTAGRGNMAVGRLFEAHVNALKLIVAYGTAAQAEAAAADAHAGRLFGLWVTDAPGSTLRWHDGVLHGSKGPCSGAGHADCALTTVDTGAGTSMAVLRLGAGEQMRPMRGLLHGMRAAVNGTVAFDGVLLDADALLGQPGDYLREPLLSTGAWRTTAVTLGGLEALVDATGRHLRRRGHDNDALQQERFGAMLIAQETARLWTGEAAGRAERDGPVADRVAYVNLARIAVETACLDAMRHAQRSVGLAAFLATNPIERMLRDLAVYLRQPAPDAVLTEAAQHGLQRL